jgi:hypothetical protein
MLLEGRVLKTEKNIQQIRNSYHAINYEARKQADFIGIIKIQHISSRSYKRARRLPFGG